MEAATLTIPKNWEVLLFTSNGKTRNIIYPKDVPILRQEAEKLKQIS